MGIHYRKYGEADVRSGDEALDAPTLPAQDASAAAAARMAREIANETRPDATPTSPSMAVPDPQLLGTQLPGAQLPRTTLPPLELPGPRRYGRVAFAVVFLIALLLFIRTLLPILSPVLLGCLVAAFVSPLRARIERWFSGRSGPAAILTVAIVLAVIVPLSALMIVVVSRITEFVSQAPEIATWVQGSAWRAWRIKHAKVIGFLPEDLGAEIERAVTWIGGLIPTVLASLVDLGLSAFLMLVTTYYLLRDGRWLLSRFEHILPLEPRHTRAIVAEFQLVGRGVIIGTLGTAAVQGALAGLGYFALGLHESLLLGVLTGIASMIPVMGSGLVWIPFSLWLFSQGEITKAFILLGYGSFVVASIDNIVRPMLCGEGMNVHPLLVFFGIFGGLSAFGPAGLYLGPLFVSLFVAVGRIYEREMAPAATAVKTDSSADISLSSSLLGQLLARRLRIKRDSKP